MIFGGVNGLRLARPSLIFHEIAIFDLNATGIEPVKANRLVRLFLFFPIFGSFILTEIKYFHLTRDSSSCYKLVELAGPGRVRKVA